MKDFIGNEINMDDKVILALYNGERELQKGKVVEILDKEGYIRVEIEGEFNGKSYLFKDVIQPQYLVVVKPAVSKSALGQGKSLFDM